MNTTSTPAHVVTIPEVRESRAELYRPGTLVNVIVGVISSVLALNDVRLQIKKHGLTGYYLVWYDPALKQQTRIDINERGQLSAFPAGFFDTFEHQLHQLVDWVEPAEVQAPKVNIA